MTALGFILIMLGSAIALIGCMTEKPCAVAQDQDQVRKPCIGQFQDRDERGRMTIPDIAPDGAQTLFKWTAIESADGHVFYGTRYLHPKEVTFKTPKKE